MSHHQPGNTVRRFHGTGLKCTLGINGKTKCCTDPTCAVCNIIQQGFDMAYSSDGRYGKGLYGVSTYYSYRQPTSAGYTVSSIARAAFETSAFLALFHFEKDRYRKCA